jgi:hypothetical protein
VQQIEENLKQLQKNSDEDHLMKAFQSSVLERFKRRNTFEDYREKQFGKIEVLNQMRKKCLSEIDEKRQEFYAQSKDQQLNQALSAMVTFRSMEGY